MSVAVVTDSTSDLPPTLLRKLGIYCVPLMMTVDGKTYADSWGPNPGWDLPAWNANGVLPKTLAPAPGIFASMYRQALAAGADAVVSIHLSGRLSATIRAAYSGKAMVSAPIEIVDSGSVSLGVGLLAWWAALSARSGASADVVAAEVRSLASRIQLGFSPATLDYLARGGRIGEAARWVGTLCDQRAVLRCEQGMIAGHKKLRGKRSVESALVESLGERVPAGGSVLAGVMHANNPQAALCLETLMFRQWQVQALLAASSGPVLAVHGGPGTVGGVVIPLSVQETLRWHLWASWPA